MASLLSGNEQNKEKELSLADAFITLLAYAELGQPGLRHDVNDLEFVIIPNPIPNKQLLEIPRDLSQFIVMPERLISERVE